MKGAQKRIAFKPETSIGSRVSMGSHFGLNLIEAQFVLQCPYKSFGTVAEEFIAIRVEPKVKLRGGAFKIR